MKNKEKELHCKYEGTCKYKHRIKNFNRPCNICKHLELGDFYTPNKEEGN